MMAIRTVWRLRPSSAPTLHAVLSGCIAIHHSLLCRFAFVGSTTSVEPSRVRSDLRIPSRLVSCQQSGSVSREQSRPPAPQAGLPRRPRLDRPRIVIIHKIYSVRLSSSEGTRSRSLVSIRLRYPIPGERGGRAVLMFYGFIGKRLIKIMRRVCAALLNGRQPRDTGGRESHSRIEHRRGSRVGVRVFNSGAKATCA